MRISDGGKLILIDAQNTSRLSEVLRVEVKLWKHLDPTQVSDLTLEPWFLRLTIKKKVFQLRFLEEVLCDR